jgi:hypothetical protein
VSEQDRSPYSSAKPMRARGLEREELTSQEIEDVRAALDVGSLLCFRSCSIWSPGLVFAKISRATRCYVWLGERRLERTKIKVTTREGTWIPGDEDFAEMRIQRAQERWKGFIGKVKIEPENADSFLEFMDCIEAKLKQEPKP